MKSYQRLLIEGVVAGSLLGLGGPMPAIAAERSGAPEVRYEQSIPVESVMGYGGGVSVVTGDVNGDGIDELIVGDLSTIKLYRNNGKFGNPVLICPSHAQVGYAAAIDLALSDIDHDGDLDLVVANTEGVALFYNDGLGNFSQ